MDPLCLRVATQIGMGLLKQSGSFSTSVTLQVLACTQLNSITTS